MITFKSLLSLLSLGASGALAAPAVYTFTSGEGGFHTQTHFVDSGREVVAIDAQFTPALAEEAIAFLRTRTKSPIRYLVVTHPNPDKFNGIPAFRKASPGLRVLAARRTADAMPAVHEYKKFFFTRIAKSFAEDAYPRLDKIDETFVGTKVLRLAGGLRVELSELAGPGVSSNQSVVSVPGLKALFVGDLVHHRAHAWLEGGVASGKAVPTIGGWIEGLRELERRFSRVVGAQVYGGRGEVAPLAIAVRDQIAYLERADRIVRDYVEGLGARKSELNGPEAGRHHAAVQALFERAFPAYALPYMVGYGVYGLLSVK